MERTDYEEKAQGFLDRNGLTIRAAFKGDRCPPWERGNKHIHGDRYRITIKRVGPDKVFSDGEPGPRSISFDWWNSYNDSHEGKRPTAYDVLSSVSSDAYCPTDPDEVLQEFGGDMTIAQAAAIAKFALRLQSFFGNWEYEDLAEIN